MTDSELEAVIKKAINIIKKKEPAACYADVADSVMDSVAKYLEVHGALDRISVSWLVLAGSRRLIDSYRRKCKNVSLEQLFDVELVPDEHVGLCDLKVDNEDLANYADSLLFPELNITEEKTDEAA